MKWSLNLGRVSGIKIIVHWTFLLLIAWVIFVESQRGADIATILITIGFVLTIFLCVVLHELGHALTAKRYDIKTKRITLLPIGGVAGLERMPEEPKKELMIAVAGPAVNIVIALFLFPFINFQQYIENPENIQAFVTGSNFLFYLFSVNLFLVIFNAIPAFPMDGGRVLRALLSFKMDRVKATNIAARLGQFLAIGFFFFGLFYNPFLVLIGIFVFFGAYSENMIVQHLQLLKGYAVKDAMMTNFSRLSPESTLKDAVDKLIEGSDTHIMVVEDDEAKGIISRPLLIQSLKEKGVDTKVTDIMKTKFETLHINNKLTDVYSKAQRKRSAFYPVIDDSKLVGVINMDNINEFVMIQSSLHY